MKSLSNFRKELALSLFLAPAVLAAVVMTSCNQHAGTSSTNTSSDSTTQVQAPPVIDTAQMKTDWENFKADASRKLKESDDSIASFKKKVAKFDKKLKIKYDKDIAVLERKNDTLKMRLDNYKIEEKEKWEDFKSKFNHDMEEISNWLRDSTATNK
jgi:hypothetical protein